MAVTAVTLYLAGPIDGVARDVACGWRNDIADSGPLGVLFFDPTRAWHGASLATAAAVDVGNRVAIAYADGVLANLSGPGWAFGTIREIEFARAQGKPVAVAMGDDDPRRRSLLTHDLLLAESVQDALDLLLERVRASRDVSQHPMFQILGLQPPQEEE